MKPKDEKVLILCPLKGTNVYEQTCLRECTWYTKGLGYKSGRCPVWDKDEKSKD